MYNPIEGVDYIFDRYEFLKIKSGLEINPDSTTQEIKKAIATIRAQNHPDSLQARGEDHQKLGQKMTDLADKCSEILLDESKRKYFNKKLDWFKENKPHLISKDGNALIATSELRINVDSLLKDAPTTELDSITKGIIQDVSPTTLRLLKNAYTQSPDDPETKQAYHEALLQRFNALEIKEDLAWQQAGVHGRFESQRNLYLVDTSFYKDDVKQEIEDTATTIIPKVVSTHIDGYLGGLSSPLLLPSSIGDNGKKEGANLPVDAKLNQEAMAALVKKAVDTFKSRTHSINMLAEEKQQVLQQILEITPTYEIQAATADSKNALIFLLNNNGTESKTALAMSFDNKTKEMKIVDPVEGYIGLTIEKLKTMKFDVPTFAIEIDKELGSKYMIAHASYCFDKYLGNEHDKQQSQSYDHTR